MVAEAQQESAVLGRQRGMEESAQVLLVGLQEGALTAADVDYQTESQRNVSAGREKRDLLRKAVLQHVEIVLLEAGDQFAVAIPHGEGDVDQVDVGAERRLAQAERGNQTHGGP